jgi:hypothetical protein
MRHVVHCCLAALGVVTFLTGCSPLPGASLDPVYLRGGAPNPATPGPAAPAPAAPTPAKPGSTAPAPGAAREAGGSPPPQAALATPAPGVPSTWVGRYRDSRGEGDLTMMIIRSATGLTGTWRLRTGGGGVLSAVAQGGDSRLQLRMENKTSECPGELEGWVEMRDAVLIGAYHGRDCDGPVSDGRFDVRPR